ncbi:hypothetical protein XI06_17015 [Bradyrhizobium sp. CCBAU 11434]|uniref:hypothetical protein n=1 Tax=Bradyrhizobium sp. CCBAU 11434 TaxID=1630885 RepID=UPI0023064BDD|nr:hypothetical protein [Bradyrhizobium sp. CCBAU 11434]MDA9521961.1 hypothetical protein [Bradyrhizobium sp. CCBAU 11434]
MLWILSLVLIGLLLIYVFIIRPWLKTLPALSASFAAEASFVEKLQARVTGWKTKIFARLVAIAGLMVGLYDQVLPYVSGQDWTPLTAKLPAWALPVGMVLASLIVDWLRKATENPPMVITQKIDGAPPQVVQVIQPPKA